MIPQHIPTGLPTEWAQDLGQGIGDVTAWRSFRSQFFPGKRINLNPATLGSPSVLVREAMRRFLDDDNRVAFPLGMYVKGREALQEARATAQEILSPGGPTPAITTGTTETLNLLAFALAASAQKKLTVLTSHHEHYGGVAVFERHPAFEVVYIDRAHLEDPDAFGEKVSEFRPDIVLLSQISWTDGVSLPIPSLLTSAKSAHPPVITLVDSAQALGLISLPAGLADAVIASAHKWLFGPFGTGFFWISPALQARIGGFHLNGETLDPNNAMSLFEVAGGQDFSRYAGVTAALKLFQAVGPDRVRTRSRALARAFLQTVLPQLKALGVSVARMRSPAEASPGMVSLQFENFDPYPVYNQLNALGVHMKCIKGTLKDGTVLNALRVGFPYYEDPENIQWAAQQLLQIVEKGA